MTHGWRLLLVALVATFVTTSVLMARTAVVTMKNGTRVEGEVVEETPDAVVIETHGVRTVIQRVDMESIETRESFEKEFADRRAKLAEGDVAARLELARWCFDQRHYPEAREIADEAAKLDPNSTDAAAMQELIRRQVSLENRAGQATPPSTPTDLHSTPASVERAFLQAGDINLIKSAELQSTDNPRFRFENGVEKRFLEVSGADAKEFSKLSPMEKYTRISKAGSVDMLRDVSIMGDPARIATYRQKVQPMMLSGCASAGCHGTMAGKGFVVFLNANGSDGATYSNYYILMQYKRMLQSEGTGLFAQGKVQRRMIDRSNPEQSLLLEYGLPRGMATYKHPQVNGLSATFRDKNDPRYKTVLAWIKTLGPIEPTYHVNYTPPGTPSEATSQPAAPATQESTTPASPAQ